MANESGGTTSIYEILNGSGILGSWSLKAAVIPDTPDDVIVVLDQSPADQGRDMHSGHRIERAGYQVILRSTSYPSGWSKIKEIGTYLDEVKDQTLTDHTVQSLKRTSGPMYIGTEETSDRHMFSLNGTISPQLS